MPVVAALLAALQPALALDPHKELNQFSSTIWTQAEGLPQDTVRAIAQTPDGYLWVGTEEGLARFDGYDFVLFSKDQGHLLSNSIMALAAGQDGSLWIGTTAGLTRYQGRRFKHYTVKDGLPDDSVTSLFVDHAGNVWIVAQGNLSRFDGKRFTNYLRERDLPLSAAAAVAEDSHHALYVVGFNSLARFDNGKFVPIAQLQAGVVPRGLKVDAAGNIWVLRTRGLARFGADGTVATYGPKDGLPDALGFGALLEDRNHNLWIGSGNKLARLEQGQFAQRGELDIGSSDSVRCLFEDSQGNLWIGGNAGLRRLRDGPFTVYGKAEGLPGGEPSTVYQDRAGTVWIGFGDGGVAAFRPGSKVEMTSYQNITRNRVFSFRETPSGDLLVSAGDGLARVHGQAVAHYVPTGDPLGRRYVYDAMEGSDGQIWLALPSGLAELKNGVLRHVIPGGPTTEDAIVALALGPDGSVWAGGRRALWQVKGGHSRRFSSADGLSSSAITSLYVDPEGTLWVGTAGGGLNRLKNGMFQAFRAKDGLLSDNISKVIDAGDSLWLSTARGISRVPKQQLEDFASRRISALQPIAYGVADGLHSAAYSPAAGAGGGHFAGGNLWLATNGGVALHQPRLPGPAETAPLIDLTEMSSEGRPLNWAAHPEVPAGSGRIQIRYTAVNLRTPERIQYSYKLDGLDSDWVRAGSRRGVNYDGLRHGRYTFHVKAALPEGMRSERAFVFEVLPRFYETTGFRISMAGLVALLAWAGYKLRERSVRSEFAAVLEERARLAREVHDTLAQGFVGISSQLDVVEMCLPKEATAARGTLDLARRMARHSLTEARRSVMDLRSTALEEDDLATALETGAGTWAAGSGVNLDVEVSGERTGLPEDVAHHILRIAQEAVTNAIKHAHASRIHLKLTREVKGLKLEVTDDGCGFERDEAFLSAHGHFGLIGMRERAERLGGELHLESHPGHGTQLAVQVPLS